MARITTQLSRIVNKSRAMGSWSNILNKNLNVDWDCAQFPFLSSFLPSFPSFLPLFLSFFLFSFFLPFYLSFFPPSFLPFFLPFVFSSFLHIFFSTTKGPAGIMDDSPHSPRDSHCACPSPSPLKRETNWPRAVECWLTLLFIGRRVPLSGIGTRGKLRRSNPYGKASTSARIATKPGELQLS